LNKEPPLNNKKLKPDANIQSASGFFLSAL